jgi:hypothetical protein
MKVPQISGDVYAGEALDAARRATSRRPTGWSTCRTAPPRTKPLVRRLHVRAVAAGQPVTIYRLGARFQLRHGPHDRRLYFVAPRRDLSTPPPPRAASSRSPRDERDRHPCESSSCARGPNRSPMAQKTGTFDISITPAGRGQHLGRRVRRETTSPRSSRRTTRISRDWSRRRSPISPSPRPIGSRSSAPRSAAT